MYWLREGSAPGGMSVPATLDSTSAKMLRYATIAPRLRAAVHSSTSWWSRQQQEMVMVSMGRCYGMGQGLSGCTTCGQQHLLMQLHTFCLIMIPMVKCSILFGCIALLLALHGFVFLMLPRLSS